MNFLLSTTMRVCFPSPIFLPPSLADRSNSIFLPLTDVIVAVAEIVAPTGLAAVWFTDMEVPTDVWLLSSAPFRTSQAARSIRAIIIGVLKSEAESTGQGWAYTFDRHGNRETLTATGPEAYGAVYHYDANNRLTDEVRTESE